MPRSKTTIALLVLSFVAGVGIVLLVMGTGSSSPPAASTGTVPPAVTPTPTAPALPTATAVATTPSTTATAPASPHVSSSQTSTAPPPVESSPQVLAERSRERAQQAERSGAKSCPALTTPAAVKDITIKHISCVTAKLVIFATTPKGHLGFACDIVRESFSDVPAVEYACKRKADKAELAYTAVG